MFCCIFKACGSYQDFSDSVLLLSVFELGRLTGAFPEFKKSSKCLSQDTITYHQTFSSLCFAVYLILARYLITSFQYLVRFTSPRSRLKLRGDTCFIIKSLLKTLNRANLFHFVL